MVRKVGRGKYSEVNPPPPPPPHTHTHTHISLASMSMQDGAIQVMRGSAPQVFEGVNVPDNQKCIIKILKPVKKKKVGTSNEPLASLSMQPGALCDDILSRRFHL